MGFKFFQILAQNPNVLVFHFNEKHNFIEKTDRNSIFPEHETHIQINYTK
jgi:hypothetical protein